MRRSCSRRSTNRPTRVADTIADRTARGDGVDLDEQGALDEAMLADVKRDRRRRLRHLLPRRADRPLRDRGVGAAAGRDRHRLRVPLPQPGRRPRRSRDRDLAVRRDRRHARRDAPGARARRDGARDHQHDGLAGHARRRRRPLHARGPGDRGGRDQDVRLPGRRHVPARAAPGGAARHARRPRGSPSWSAEIKRLPHCIDELIGDCEEQADDDRAQPTGRRDFFLYIGRHVGLPVALEGALKLKEISYIATDAYAAGEMKHGPIALLDEATPVVCVATRSPVLEKLISNIQEVRARGARVIAVTTAGEEPSSATPTRDRGARDRLDAAADPRGDPAAAARLRDRPPPRPERRPAAQPRQDRHRRVARIAPNAGATAI